MIDKELIELQKGCKATCVVIQNENIEELDSKYIVDADINDGELLIVFKENLLSNEQFEYFVIKAIDGISVDMQEKYTGIVKDRRFGKYCLPENMIIVLTVSNKDAMKKLSRELYNFCVVAF